jgi:4-hydroxysphinganine ceramide fatty acyl 2-hydroxylase
MYSRQEVAKHNTAQDAWVVYKSKVLDVTTFLESHPGGKEVLTPLLGQDVSEAFSSVEHSYSAIRMIDGMKVGTIEGAKNNAEQREKQAWDPKKGMVWQVWFNLSLAEYLDMVNHPTHLSHHVRLFDSPWLEPVTRTKWYIVPLLWLPVAAYYLSLGIRIGIWTVLFFLLGVLLWTLMEYGLHRFVFHSESRFKENNGTLAMLHFLCHGIHHAFPMDE